MNVNMTTEVWEKGSVVTTCAAMVYSPNMILHVWCLCSRIRVKRGGERAVRESDTDVDDTDGGYAKGWVDCGYSAEWDLKGTV